MDAITEVVDEAMERGELPTDCVTSPRGGEVPAARPPSVDSVGSTENGLGVASVSSRDSMDSPADLDDLRDREALELHRSRGGSPGSVVMVDAPIACRRGVQEAVDKTKGDIPSAANATLAPPRKSAGASMREYLETLSAGLMVRGVLPYMVIYGCVKGVVYIFIYWMPFFLVSSKGQSNSVAAVVSGIFDIGAFVGAILSGYATDRLGSRTAVVIIMILVSIVFTFVLFDGSVSSVSATTVCLLFIGMSIGGAQTLISASVALDLGDSALNRSSLKRPVAATSTMSVSCLAAVNTVTAGGNETQDMAQRSAKKLAGTISGLMEGSGSTGAAVLQYMVGQLLVCSSSVTCSWTPILIIIVVANIISLTCLMYIKFSSRVAALLGTSQVAP